MSERFELSTAERHSPLWVRLSDHLDALLSTARQQNDIDKDAIETAKLRGKIAAYKQIKGLGDEPRPAED